MEYVKLGNTGMDVSPICLGCMSFGSAEGWVHNQWALDEEASRTMGVVYHTCHLLPTLVTFLLDIVRFYTQIAGPDIGTET